MSRTRLNEIGLLLLGSTVLFEMVGCGGRIMSAGPTDSSVQTSTETGTGTNTGVQTVTGLGTITDIFTATYTYTVPLTATYSYTGSSFGSGVFTISDTGVLTSTRTGTGTGIVTRSRTNTFTRTGVNTILSTRVITSTISSTRIYTITSTGVLTISSTGSGTSVGCAYAVPPTASGTLAVTGGYVTSGTLRGYGFTWKSDQSNATTCIVPTCNTTGCSPAFGSSALCASGYVTADTTYNSAVGVGFNLNQDSSGTTNLTVPAPASVTVTTSLFGGAMGNPAMRVQITDAAGTSWCVEAGQWASGTPIPISSFNTACWDSMTGKTLTAGQPIQSINLVIPADAVMDRPFAFCLTGVSL